MSLDLTSFQKALSSLKKAINRSQTAPNDEELRDSVILRFGYTYERSWKMLKRQLEAEVPPPTEIDTMSFKDLFREGAVRGFIVNPEAWLEYREKRSITSHTYDKEKATEVYQVALRFVHDAGGLMVRLQERA